MGELGPAVAEQLARQLGQLRRGHRLAAQLQLAPNTQGRHHSALEMKVRRAFVRHELQETIKIHDLERILQEMGEMP